MNFDTWLGTLRDLIHEDGGILDYGEGSWRISDRRAIWSQFGNRIFDSHLDLFRSCAVEVLSEIDPKFTLVSEERYAAGVQGKVLQHSEMLRQGMAETVALLGNEGSALTNCSHDKAKLTALRIVRALFKEQDWRIWASVDRLLPTIAEGAPEEFLSAVQNTLLSERAPFDELFGQEGEGMFGDTYISGLLWALEGLAWNEDHIVRVATLLADLAARDPGGKWSNRPDNSLVSILLPWYPQTFAAFEKQLACLKAVQHDHPDVAWKVLIRLLPNQRQTTSGTHKPSWFMRVPEDWRPSVTHVEYRQKIARYAEMAVEMAFGDLDRLKDLVGELDNLPQASFEQVLDYLSSDDLGALNEDDRLPIWTSIDLFARKHRRFQSAKWALPMEVVERLDAIAKSLAPVSPEGRFRHLFTNNDFDLYEENGDWEAQSQILEDKRQQAVSEIWVERDLDRVVMFSQTTSSPYKVGWAFAKVADETVEASMLPGMLDSEGEFFQFVHGFLLGRYISQGLEWLEKLSHVQWNANQKSQFLICLPFDGEAWTRAVDWLGGEEGSYWRNVVVNPYQTTGDLIFAVDKLLDYGRPVAALDCLFARHQNGLPLDYSRTVNALLGAVSSDEPRSTMDHHHVLELIKALQADPVADPEGLFRVEWAYVTILDGLSGVKPKLLEQRLAFAPEFFCEAIRLIYCPEGVDRPEEIDEESRSVATNAWQLLHEWQWPPGTRDDGSFSEDDFVSWLEIVKHQCVESGHLDVALTKVGEVLFYCPEDPGGLWINEVVAKQLNAGDAAKMRDGFQAEVFNSRGVYSVDPTGKPERDLAEQWRQKAAAVEEAGYARFGATLRQLAGSYDREADRVIVEHAKDD